MVAGVSLFLKTQEISLEGFFIVVTLFFPPKKNHEVFCFPWGWAEKLTFILKHHWVWFFLNNIWCLVETFNHAVGCVETVCAPPPSRMRHCTRALPSSLQAGQNERELSANQEIKLVTKPKSFFGVFDKNLVREVDTRDHREWSWWEENNPCV